MAEQLKLLGNGTFTVSDTWTNIYTVPAGKAAVIKAVYLQNDNNGFRNCGLKVVKSGEANNLDKQTLHWRAPAAAYETLVLGEGITLAAGDALQAFFSLFANTRFLVMGVEVDAPAGYKVLGQRFSTAGVWEQLYQVPAGKRAHVSLLTACSQGAAPTTIWGAISVNGGAIGTAINTFVQQRISYAETYYAGPYELGPLDILWSYSNAALQSFNAFGVEVPA